MLLFRVYALARAQPAAQKGVPCEPAASTELTAALCAKAGMAVFTTAVHGWMLDPVEDLHARLDRAFQDLCLAANALR